MSVLKIQEVSFTFVCDI